MILWRRVTLGLRAGEFKSEGLRLKADHLNHGLWTSPAGTANGESIAAFDPLRSCSCKAAQIEYHSVSGSGNF
jgi:hypothetical protein